MTCVDGPKIHNGKYTVESTATGEHRTFEIRTQAADAAFAPGRRVVALLTGSQNDDPDAYTGFAFADEDGVHVWSSKCGKGLWEQYAEILWSLALDGAFSPWAERGYRLLVEGRCIVCNRVLTEPISIKNGIGPICAGR